jgi:outer membrane protein OmpA-like peptidoglycan-associated protein
MLAARIVQVDFGRDARFAVCIPPACPVVTPKTLAGQFEAPRTDQASSGHARITVDASPNLVPAPSETLRPVNQTAPVRFTARRPAASPPLNQSRGPERPSQPIKTSTKSVTVHFASGAATLTAAESEQIDAVIADLHAARRITISAHTDNVGSAQANQALSLARANTVRDLIRDRHPPGVSPIAVEAHGACCAIASNQTAQGRALNRRVDIVVELAQGDG